MVVIVILSLAIVPALMRQADMTARDLEAGTCKLIVSGLESCTVKTRTIPGTNTMAQDVALQLGWLTSDVNVNSRGRPRYFVVDPNLRIGTTNGTLPYVQTNTGSIQPISPRLMVVTTLGRELPSAAISPTAAQFEQIWNSADRTAPTGWTNGGFWEDIVVERVNLGLLFVQIILNNNPTPALTNMLGRYSVDFTNSQRYLPTNGPLTTFLLKGSALGLHNSYGALQVVQVLTDTPQTNNTAYYKYYQFPSFVYDYGVWRGKMFLGPNGGLTRCGADLQAAYEVFMSGSPNVYKVGGVNQSTVTWSMYLFMSNYVNWASSVGPTTPLPHSGTLWNALDDAQAEMDSEINSYYNKMARAP
jgi:hypothetical protein